MAEITAIPTIAHRPRRGRAKVFAVAAVGVLLVVLAIVAPALAPHDPVQVELGDRLLPPAWVDGGSTNYFLGTDSLGRDVLSRMLHGARVSLSVAGLAIVFGGVVGGLIGIVSGFVGGMVDTFLMRIVDIFLALPTVLVAIALAVAVGPSFRNIVFVIAVLLWPKIARQVRGDALVIKEENYVKYARATGAPAWWQMVRHVLPNVTPALLVVATLEVGQVILLEATLGFLGAGIPPPDPSWGLMVAEGGALIATGWWVALFAGLAICLTVLTFNVLGDWLRDHLDPRLRQR